MENLCSNFVCMCDIGKKSYGIKVRENKPDTEGECRVHIFIFASI